MPAFTLESFRKRIKDVDPDLRQMALFDLQQELSVDAFTIEEKHQSEVVEDVLRGLSDKNSEVQSNAVRCLAPMIRKVSETRVQHIVTSLINGLVDNSIRDTVNMGFKTVIEKLSSLNVCRAAVQSLLQTSKEENCRGEILELLSELVKRFGKDIKPEHESIQKFALGEIMSGKPNRRKRAVNCLAQLSVHSDSQLFSQIVTFLLQGLEKYRNDELRRHIQMCSSISRIAGSRFGAAGNQIIPLLFRELDRLKAANDESEDSDECRENILQAFDSLVGRCAGVTNELVSGILHRCVELVKWDPNYVEVDDPSTEFEDDGEADDDGDFSWKVRKCAARCLQQIVRCRREQVTEVVSVMLATSSPILATRFRERVESVRGEVFELFAALLEVSSERSKLTHKNSNDASSGDQMRSAELTEIVIRELVSSLRHPSGKMRIQVFALLREYSLFLGTALPSVSSIIVAVLKEFLAPSSAAPQLRVEVLSFARVFVAQTLQPSAVPLATLSNVESIVSDVVACVDDRYFKTVVAAVRTCLEFVPLCNVSRNSVRVATQIFDAIFAKLLTPDVDHEVKKVSIDSLSLIIKNLGSILSQERPSQLEKSFQLFGLLLKNEVTRLSATHAIVNVCDCNINLQVLTEYVTELTSLLRKTDRQLREAALRTLVALCERNARKLPTDRTKAILDEVCSSSTTVLSDKELYLTSLGLQLCRCCSVPSLGQMIAKTLVPRVFEVAASPLIQGRCLKESCEVIHFACTLTEVPFGEVHKCAIEAVRGSSGTSAANIAALAAVVIAADPDERRKSQVIADFVGTLKIPIDASNYIRHTVALAILGELGQKCDLNKIAGAVDGIKMSLGSQKEEVKTAAAGALGRAASSIAGAALLEDLIRSLEQQTDKYFLLRALREAVNVVSNDPSLETSFRLEATRKRLSESLLKTLTSQEESVREVAAECLGRLIRLDSSVLEVISRRLSQGASIDELSALLTAVKYSITDQQIPGLDEKLTSTMPSFFALLTKPSETASQQEKESSLGVRKAAIQVISAAAYCKPDLLNVAPFRTVFGSIVDETKVDTTHIRSFDLGPCKHIVDKGLELRKSAFEAVDSLVERSLKDHPALLFVSRSSELWMAVVRGLDDPNSDIVAMCRSLCVKLARCQGGALIEPHLDDIVKLLVAALVRTAAKEGQDKQQLEDSRKSSAMTLVQLESSLSGTVVHVPLTDAANQARAKFPEVAQLSEPKLASE